MSEKQSKLTASNFRFPSATDNRLIFNLNVKGSTVLSSHCSPCVLKEVCFGEKGQKSGEGRISLDKPLVKNLTPEDAQNVPCGAGIEIIQRRSSRN